MCILSQRQTNVPSYLQLDDVYLNCFELLSSVILLYLLRRAASRLQLVVSPPLIIQTWSGRPTKPLQTAMLAPFTATGLTD